MFFFILSPIYVPVLVFLMAKSITSTERTHPAVFNESEFFIQMKKSTSGLKAAAAIPLCIPFLLILAMCILSSLFNPHSKNEADLIFVMFFVTSAFVAIIGCFSFYFYNYLFLARTFLKSAAILAIPYLGLVVCQVFLCVYLESAEFLVSLIPFFFIFLIMLPVLKFKRSKFIGNV